jgi:hypothetical protein
MGQDGVQMGVLGPEELKDLGVVAAAEPGEGVVAHGGKIAADCPSLTPTGWGHAAATLPR